MDLRLEDVFSYFRLGLATGLVEKQAVLAWADQQLLQNPNADERIIELSLSGSLPYSQLIWRLSSFLVQTEYNLPLKLLFARAGSILAANPERASELIQSLRLLIAEEHLPQGVRLQLTILECDLDLDRHGVIAQAGMVARLLAFLESYQEFQRELSQVDCS